MPSVLTLEAVLRSLAEKEANCQDCHGAGAWFASEPTDSGWTDVRRSCGVCNGTGRVARFPMFRKSCPVLVIDAYDVQYGFGNRHHPDKCQRCKGKEWLPISASEAHLEIVLPLLGSVVFREGVDFWTVLELPDEDGYMKKLADGETPLEAALCALLEAVQQEEKAP